MLHTRTQTDYDRKLDVVRYDDVCFAASETEDDINIVFKEIAEMKQVGPALMTAGALKRYMELPMYVVEKMRNMEIGSSFIYNGNTTITKWSEHTYNGRNIEKQ